MQLSEHFSLREFTRSQTASRKGIDNTPLPLDLKRMEMLCEMVLEPIRERWGVVNITSGYRSPALNAVIPGSSGSSQHRTGEAADIECPGADNLELAQWIRDNLNFDQVISEYYVPGDPLSGWVHVSYDYDRPQRKMALTKREGKAYMPGLPGDGAEEDAADPEPVVPRKVCRRKFPGEWYVIEYAEPPVAQDLVYIIRVQSEGMARAVEAGLLCNERAHPGLWVPTDSLVPIP